MSDDGWRRTQVLAWTDHDGPGRPPNGGPTWMWLTTAATLGVVLSGILVTDSLCPEHRTWVHFLATLGIAGVGTSIAGLVRGWASAPLLTVLSAFVGVAIGAIDAVHAPLRGGIIAGGFVAAMLLALVLALSQRRLARWDAAVRAAASTDAAPYGPAAVASAPAPSGRRHASR